MIIGGAALLVALYTLLPSGDSPAPKTSHLRANRLTAVPDRTEFLIVTDLDKRSADATSKKPRWKALLKKVSAS